jgi:hypothetical protein
VKLPRDVSGGEAARESKAIWGAAKQRDRWKAKRLPGWTPARWKKLSAAKRNENGRGRLTALVVRQAMKYFKAMKREDIIRDIHGLDTELAALEEQYGLLSDDFYHFYRAGELEQTRDFIRWAGFYEAKQERETSYRQLIYEHLRELRRRSGLGALALDPAGA